MNRNHIYPIVLGMLILTGCDAVHILFSRDCEAKVETAESVNRFVKKKRIDGYPIVCLDPIYVSSFYLLPDYPFFNSEGEYLALRDDTQGCIADNYYYLILKYLLEHGDTSYIADSVTRSYYTLHDPDELVRLSENPKSSDRPDRSKWILHMETLEAHLNNYIPYFRTLEGEKIDLSRLYTDYLLISTFSMSGRSSLTCVLVRETIRDVKKLNKEFGNRIQIVLINTDEMDWMKNE
ncbi:MAG TPA: hypothetical protein VI603_11825 [Saprospiraceae bacterium]|nr:hypothetical protein [Saprospiraceae bacterium]